MANKGRTRWAWISRLLGLPGAVKGLVTGLAAMLSILTKAWLATLGLAQPYQLALTSAAGIVALCAGAIVIPPLVRRIPTQPPRSRLRLRPVAVGSSVNVLIENRHRSQSGTFIADITSFQLGNASLPLEWRLAWVGNAVPWQRIHSDDSQTLRIVALAYQGQQAADGSPIVIANWDPGGIHGDSGTRYGVAPDAVARVTVEVRDYDGSFRGAATIRLEISWQLDAQGKPVAFARERVRPP